MKRRESVTDITKNLASRTAQSGECIVCGLDNSDAIMGTVLCKDCRSTFKDASGRMLKVLEEELRCVIRMYTEEDLDEVDVQNMLPRLIGAIRFYKEI